MMVTLTDPNFKHKDKDETKITVGRLTIKGTPYPDTITWPTAAPLTYGQKLADSNLTGGLGVDKGKFTWEASDIIPTVENSGYTVVFTPTDTNYSTVLKIISIDVAKATPTLTTPTAVGITYGDTLEKSVLSGGSASAQHGGAATAVPGRYTWTAPETMPDCSDSNMTGYALIFTPEDTDNYNIVDTGEITLTVDQRAVGLRWDGHTGLVYTGSAVKITATATNLVGVDTCGVTVTDGAKTDAGDYTAKATALAHPNYALPAAATQTYSIAKKPIKVFWSDMFPTYDGTAKTPTVALEGVVNSEDCTVQSTSSAAGSAGRY